MDKKKCGEYIRKNGRKRDCPGRSLRKNSASASMKSIAGRWEIFPPWNCCCPCPRRSASRWRSSLRARTARAKRARSRRRSKGKKHRSRRSRQKSPESVAGPAVGAIPKPKKKLKKQESYYDEVNRRVAKIVPEPPSGENGFSAGERRFGTVICVLFMAVVLIFQAVRLVGWLGRERVLTPENYREYIEISVVATDAENGFVTNPDRYTVSVSAKKGRIEDFSIVVEVAFYNPFSGMNPDADDMIYRTVEISDPSFSYGEETFSFERIVMDGEIRVKSVEGKLP